jgi:hypothetical protein
MVPFDCADVRCTSLRITPQLISISLAAENAPILSGVFALADYVPYTAVGLTPLVPNVSGWAVFGNHQPTGSELYILNAPAGKLARRAVQVIDKPPIRRMLLLDHALDRYIQGVVTLTPDGSLRIRSDSVDPQRMILTLDSDAAPLFLNPLDKYADSGMCGVPPIRRISGVSADANGILTIRFAGKL